MQTVDFALLTGSGRPAWIHVELPARNARGEWSAEVAWDALAAPLHEAGALATPALDLGTLMTLRSLGGPGQRNGAQSVLALQLLRRDSPELGELLGVRIVRITTVVIGDVVVSARHRDRIVVVRAPGAASLTEICAALAQDGDPLDAEGLRARVAQVVPPVDAPGLRTVVHDAVTAELVDVVASLEELLVVDDGELGAAVEPLERAVEQAERQTPDGRAGERYREALTELRRMHGRTRTIVGGRVARRLAIAVSIVVIPVLVVEALAESGVRLAWSLTSARLLVVGLSLIVAQLYAWASPAPSSAGVRGFGAPGPAGRLRPDWVPGAVGLLFVLAAVVVAGLS